VKTADFYLQSASPMTIYAIQEAQLMGTEISEGAYLELQQIWEANGMPGNSFDEWLKDVILGG
jgi:hypothetical protein